MHINFSGGNNVKLLKFLRQTAVSVWNVLPDFSASYIVSINRDSFGCVTDGRDVVIELCQYANFTHSSASDTVHFQCFMYISAR